MSNLNILINDVCAPNICTILRKADVYSKKIRCYNLLLEMCIKAGVQVLLHMHPNTLVQDL